MADELNALKEKMDQLKKEYKQNLPLKTDQIIKQWNSWRDGNWEIDQFNELLNSVHKLAGSGGVFGYSKVSEVAQKIEITLREDVGSKKRMKSEFVNKIDLYLDELKKAINS
jgi:HPt (histidine-containing phosphotransfer) domain-containing protein